MHACKAIDMLLPLVEYRGAERNSSAMSHRVLDLSSRPNPRGDATDFDMHIA